MNPYLLLVLGVAWVASLGGTAWMAYDYGESATIARQKKLDDIVRQTREAAQQGAAAAIAKIKPINTTIRQEVRREIETNTVYRDCRVPAAGVRLANDALLGGAERAGGGQLPAAHADVPSP